MSRTEEHHRSSGSMRSGPCFFGWLTVTGTAVLLTALLSAVGAAAGLNTQTDPQAAVENPGSVGPAGAVVLLAVVVVAYFAGGYVAGLIARADGIRQGVGVWLCAVVAAVVVAVLGVVAGARFDILTNLDGLPRLPLLGASPTAGGVAVAVVLLLASLLGAVLGGRSGARASSAARSV